MTNIIICKTKSGAGNIFSLFSPSGGEEERGGGDTRVSLGNASHAGRGLGVVTEIMEPGHGDTRVLTFPH